MFVKRFISTVVSPSGNASYGVQLEKARKACVESLRKHDKSSFVLSAYVPSPARDTFLAIRAFQLEMMKISNNDQVNTKLRSTLGFSSLDMKFKIWEDLLQKKVFDAPYNDHVIGEPVGILLREAIRQEFNLNIGHFTQIMSSRKYFLERGQFANIDDICSFGEGFYSQFNYLVQNLLLSEQLSPSTISLLGESSVLRDLSVEIMAHLGQATSIASIVIGTRYYATQDKVYLPIDLMTKHDISQESLLRLFQGHLQTEEADKVKIQLKDVIYESCIVANDHLLTARNKLDTIKSEIETITNKTTDSLILKRSKTWKRGIPDCLYVPMMNSIPLEGYLRQLEHHDFNIVDHKIENAYWKLVWNSYRSYKNRAI